LTQYLKMNESSSKIQIIFEIANNHQGSISHFENILNNINNSIKGYEDFFDFKVKFQFRDLPTFIDQSIDPNSNKHIQRFRDTELTKKNWLQIIKLVKSKGLKVMVTPFDEISVQKAIEFGVDEFKIASCSCTEWSLLEEVLLFKKPLTISTGGRNLSEVDKIYSYLASQIPNKFTIMHCCGIYPAPSSSLNLNTIRKFIDRYPLAKIGYSGHEDPSDHFISSLAVSLGAVSLERHIGKEDKEKNIKLNTYSIDSKFIGKWLEQIKNTIICLGTPKSHNYFNQTEIDSLKTLQRGVVLNKKVYAGSIINPKDCIFKFPIQENQIPASQICSNDYNHYAKFDIESGSRITNDLVEKKLKENILLKEYIHKIRGIINEYGECVPRDVSLEISHHYGLEKIDEYGCCLITIVNRNYCKKLIIMTKGQSHPTQHHKIKEETFRILHGELELLLNDEKNILKLGDEALVKVGHKHAFKANTDCIFEEISSTSINDDSYYDDEKVNSMKRVDRKSISKLHFS